MIPIDCAVLALVNDLLVILAGEEGYNNIVEFKQSKCWYFDMDIDI